MVNLVEYISDNGVQEKKTRIVTKSSNTYQEHKFKLKDQDDNPRDLTGAEATAYIANKEHIVLVKPLEIDNAEEGIVKFHFYKDENIPKGDYSLEIRVTYDDGEHYEVFPSKSFIPVMIVEDLFEREKNINVNKSLSILIDRAVKTTAEAVEQGNFAKEQGEYAKEQGELAEDIVNNGTVVSVNGKKGIVTGIAEQSDIDSLTSQLNDTNSQLAQKVNTTDLLRVNVKHPPIPMVGAVGDGIADDFQVIENILNLVKESGGEVEFPTGKYRHTQSILIPGNVTLVGAGKSSSWGIGAPSKLLKDGDFDGIITDGSNAGLKNITLEGIEGNGGDGLYIRNGRANLINVEVTGMGGDAIKIGGKAHESSKKSTNFFYLENVTITNCQGRGLYIGDEQNPSLPDAGAGTITQIDIRETQGDGIFVDGALDVVFQNPAVQHCKGWGVNLGPNCKSAKFFGVYVEYNQAGEYWIQPGARRNYFFSQRDTQPMDMFIDEGESTFILGRDNNNSDTMAINKLQFSDLQISDTAISGRWKFKQNPVNRNLELDMIATSADAIFDINKGIKVKSIELNSNRINDYIFVSSGVDFGGIDSMEQKEVIIDVPGVDRRDSVVINVVDLPNKILPTAYVSVEGQVIIRLFNLGEYNNVGRISYRLSIFKPY